MKRAPASLVVLMMFAIGASVAAAQDPSAPIYDEDVVATYQLTMSATDWNEIVNDPFGQGDLWQSATMTWQGETLTQVAVKAVGHASKIAGNQKPSIRLKFDELVPNRLWKGVDSVKLDSMVGNTDPSMMVDRLSYWVHRSMGPAPRSCHARLYVNGAFKGLYEVEEPIRKAFIRSHFPIPNPDGNLYEVSIYDEINNRYRGAGFDHYLWRGSTPATYVPSIFAPVTNETGGNYADIVALVDRLNNGLASDRRTRLEAVMNLDKFLGYLAVVIATSNWDAIQSLGGAAPNNHFWYHREDTGKLEVIAWDPGVALGNWTTNDMTTMDLWFRFETNKATAWIQGDAVARDAYLAKLRQVVDGSLSSLQGRLDFVYAQIKSHAYADANKPFSNAQFDAAVGKIRNDFLPRRIAYLRSRLPAATSVGISAGDASASEPGTNTGTFVVSRTGSTSLSLIVNLARAGTAVNGTDYLTLPSSVTIPAGAASTTILLTPKDDTTVESSETVILSIAAGASYAVGSPSSATVTIADNDSATLVNNAQYVSHAVPSSMTAGATATVTIAMKNTGTKAWTAADKYALGHSTGATPWTWRERRVWLAAGESVAPGATKTFSFSITAPSTAGSHAFPRWMMVQDGVEYFGSSSPALNINVTGGGGGVATKSFQDGVLPTTAYAGTRDAYITRDNPTTNFGALSSVLVDGDTSGTGNDARALLKWYVTDIPPGSTVQSAKIVLYATNSSTQTYEVYRLYRYWSELQATWNQTQTGTLWQIAGADGSADRGQTVRGALTATSTGPTTITLNSVGVSMVQAWVNDPASNFGVILLDSANSDSILFASKEASTASQRPRLEVTYTAPTAVLSEVELAPADGAIDGEENPLTFQDALEGATTPEAGSGPGGGGGSCGALGLEAVLLMALVGAIHRRKIRMG